jgi:hypothetical protein
MQENQNQINVKYILMTESVSFIPDNILNCCETVHISRPTKSALTKCMGSSGKLPIKMEQMSNIKNVHCGMNELMQPHKIICDKIICEMIKIDELKFLAFRDMLYDIFIYNLDVGECVWYILTYLTTQGHLHKHVSKALIKTFTFFQFYNNNYRPIYHLESYLFYLIQLIHFN